MAKAIIDTATAYLVEPGGDHNDPLAQMEAVGWKVLLRSGEQAGDVIVLMDDDLRWRESPEGVTSVILRVVQSVLRLPRLREGVLAACLCPGCKLPVADNAEGRLTTTG